MLQRYLKIIFLIFLRRPNWCRGWNQDKNQEMTVKRCLFVYCVMWQDFPATRPIKDYYYQAEKRRLFLQDFSLIWAKENLPPPSSVLSKQDIQGSTKTLKIIKFLWCYEYKWDGIRDWYWKNSKFRWIFYRWHSYRLSLCNPSSDNLLCPIDGVNGTKLKWKQNIKQVVLKTADFSNSLWFREMTFD